MKLSFPMVRALRNLHAGRRSDFGLHGRSASGGHDATMVALHKRGLYNMFSGTITQAGRDLVDRLILEDAAIAQKHGDKS